MNELQIWLNKMTIMFDAFMAQHPMIKKVWDNKIILLVILILIALVFKPSLIFSLIMLGVLWFAIQLFIEKIK